MSPTPLDLVIAAIVGVARDRRARARAAAQPALRQPRAVSRPAPPSRWRWRSSRVRRSARRRSRRCCRSACRTCRSTCASTRCRRSSCCCWAPRARRSRCSPPATSARARAPRPASSASSTTRSSRRWRWCSSPTTRTCSWWRGKRWRWRRSSSSRPSTASPRSAAPASSTSLIAHVGAIAILLCFGVLQGGSGDYTFGSMRSMTLTGAWPTVAFFLALVGLRRQGGPPAAARLAARGAPGGAVAGLGADERRDAEDGDLRPAARRVRPPPRPALVVGRGRARARPRRPRSSASSSPPCRPT